MAKTILAVGVMRTAPQFLLHLGLGEPGPTHSPSLVFLPIHTPGKAHASRGRGEEWGWGVGLRGLEATVCAAIAVHNDQHLSFPPYFISLEGTLLGAPVRSPPDLMVGVSQNDLTPGLF